MQRLGTRTASDIGADFSGVSAWVRPPAAGSRSREARRSPPYRAFRVGEGVVAISVGYAARNPLRPTSSLVRHTWRSRVGTGQDAPFIEFAASWSGGISALTVVLARDRDGAISQALRC